MKALEVTCPVCDSSPGWACGDGISMRRTPHAERTRLARETKEAQA